MLTLSQRKHPARTEISENWVSHGWLVLSRFKQVEKSRTEQNVNTQNLQLIQPNHQGSQCRLLVVIVGHDMG